MEPISIFTSMRSAWLISSCCGSVMVLRKPRASAVTEYMPIGKSNTW